MFEGCLQAMAFYLAALGFTLDRDGWRFEPVAGRPYAAALPRPGHPGQQAARLRGLRPRGLGRAGADALRRPARHRRRAQGLPRPARRAAARAGLAARALAAARRARGADQRHPGTARLARRTGRPPRAQAVAGYDGFPFDYASLLACAWGRPSDAFGAVAEAFDGTRRVARLPGPPYHFMSRIVAVDGAQGGMRRAAAWSPSTTCPTRPGTSSRTAARPCRSPCCWRSRCSPAAGWPATSAAR